jgi:hypothetical protein
MLKILNIRPSLFWDVDPEILSEENSRTLIIERVTNLGNLSEWLQIVRFYGLDTIKEELVKAGDLYPKTIAFIESYLEIPKSNLRCYTRKQLNQPHWNL